MVMAGVTTLSSFAQSGIFGKWKTIDDETGKPKSFVVIYQNEEKEYGKIISLFPEPSENPNPVCEECDDYRKNKEIIGMEIVTGMHKNGDEWVDGEILDPENGKVYRCKLWVENGKLKVMGYIAFFYRIQTWLKIG